MRTTQQSQLVLPTEPSKIISYCFKPLNIWLVCYTAIGNQSFLVKGENYKKREVAFNVRYYKEIMKGEKKPLYFSIEKPLLSFKHCSFNRMVGTEGKLEVFTGQVSGRK